MFIHKYTASLLDSKWVPIKRNLKFIIIPRLDEHILLEGQYYQVISIIHVINPIDIFIIVNKVDTKLNDIEILEK